MTVIARLQTERIRVEDLVAAVAARGDGGLVVFLGTVRDENRGRRVLQLEYEAYDEMARTAMARLGQEARERFAISAVAIVHRTGKLEIGEVALGVAVAAPHRGDALAACGWVVDTLKRSVPIWKKETFEGGEVWIEGAGESPRPDQP